MANAGSGKTTRLTDRVLRLLLLGVAAERILCLTYTKAAASEMRHRVLRKLRALLLMDDAACRTEVSRLIAAPATAEHIGRARQLFGAVLDSPGGGVQLTTIHGFCQNLLRRFPMEAGVAPHFTVLEAAQAEMLLTQAKYAVLRDGHADADLASALALLGARASEFRFDALAQVIVSKRGHFRRMWHMQSAASLRSHVWQSHGLAVGDTRETIAMAFVTSLSAADEATLRQHLPAMLQQSTAYVKLAHALDAWLALDAHGRIAALDGLMDEFLTKDDKLLRKQLVSKKLFPEDSALAQALGRFAQGIAAAHMRYAALACAEETWSVAILARALDAAYSWLKHAQHALDYDDLVTRALALCSAPDTIGWVMSKLDHRIDHLMIDEAQDNSLAQWELARLLVDELMDDLTGSASGLVPRSLLVVGDEKQSIYSFQGAAPEQFGHYRALFKALLAGREQPMLETLLPVSFRSTPAVISAVDAVCADPAVMHAITSLGGAISHQLHRQGDAGRVMLHPPVVTPKKPDIPPLTIAHSYHESSSAAQLLAEAIARTVRGWLDEKRVLSSTGLAITAGDILVLVRRRTRLVQTLIRALQQRGVPVAGIDRLTLCDHLAVADLLALMRWCLNPGDDLALAQVLRSPLVGMSDEALRRVAHGRSGSLWAAIEQPWLAKLHAMRGATPYEFLTEVLEVDDKRTAFAARFGAEVHEVLDEFKAQAAAMPATMLTTLAQFHDWMAQSSREIKREQESTTSGMVRIMTVHGAKGLEAPVVILADTSDVPTTQREILFDLKGAKGQPLMALSLSPLSKFAPQLVAAKALRREVILAEYYRLLYVAMTRACDELHVFGHVSSKGTMPDACWYKRIEAALKPYAMSTNEGGLLAQDEHKSGLQKAAKPSAKAAPVLPAWATAPAPVPEHVPQWLSPSRLADAPAQAATLSDVSGDARERGVAMHRVLECMGGQETEASITRLVAHICGAWSAAAQATMVAQIMALYTDCRWLWQHTRMAEVNISGVVRYDGHALPVSGQIDALVDTGQEIIIIDYKTGSHVPKTPESVSALYILQLKTYREVVAQIYPDRPVRCALLWTHTPHLMWMDAVVENTAFPNKDVMFTAPDAA